MQMRHAELFILLEDLISSATRLELVRSSLVVSTASSYRGRAPSQHTTNSSLNDILNIWNYQETLIYLEESDIRIFQIQNLSMFVIVKMLYCSLFVTPSTRYSIQLYNI